MRAPRALACSSSSSTSTPAPSPITKPSRSTSNGREACFGSSLRVLMAFIAQKPPMPMGTMVASLPPANMTWASPILMVRQASPMAWVAVAQAEQVATLGPRNLWNMLNRPEAILRISIGIMNGESRPGPLFKRIECCSAVVSRPPIPEPMKTPIWSRSTLFKSRPESIRACHAACTPNWAKRSERRASLGEGKAGEASKCFTSPAICVSKGAGSKCVIRSMPHWPARRFCHKVSTSLPSGVTAPKPVMTTRRSEVSDAIKSNGAAWADTSRSCPGKVQWKLLAAQVLDVLDHVAHALELLGFLVGYFVAELLFKSHDQFDRIQGVGPQVFNELGIRSHLVCIDTQLLDDDLLDSCLNGFFCSHDGSPFLFCVLAMSRARSRQAPNREPKAPLCSIARLCSFCSSAALSIE